MFPFFLALYNGSQVSIVALWATCYYMLGGNLGSLLYGDVRRCFRDVGLTTLLMQKFLFKIHFGQKNINCGLIFKIFVDPIRTELAPATDKKIQATLVTSTMHSSILLLTSSQTTGPDFIPYMFFAFQLCLPRFFVNSIKRVIRHKFSTPVINFSSFFDA